MIIEQIRGREHHTRIFTRLSLTQHACSRGILLIFVGHATFTPPIPFSYTFYGSTSCDLALRTYGLFLGSKERSQGFIRPRLLLETKTVNQRQVGRLRTRKERRSRLASLDGRFGRDPMTRSAGPFSEEGRKIRGC